jgi:Polysaccharide biosynthesis protein.
MEQLFTILFVIKGIIYFGINFWIARCYANNKMRVAAGIKALREAGVLFVSRLASMLYTNCSILIFGLFLSATQIGALVLAEKVARAFASLVGPLNQTFFPEACASVSAGQEQKNTLVGVSFG